MNTRNQNILILGKSTDRDIKDLLMTAQWAASLVLLATLIVLIVADQGGHTGFFPLHRSRALAALHSRAGLRMIDVDGCEITRIEELGDDEGLLWATNHSTKCDQITALLREQAVLRPEEHASGGDQISSMLLSGSCAVVGASGARVSRMDFGTEIDRHDTVIRINNNPTGAYPEQSSELDRLLGIKTSMADACSEFHQFATGGCHRTFGSS